MTPEYRAGGARVVEMDVREHDVRHAGQRLPLHGQRRFERLDRRSRTGIDDGGTPRRP
jgi:hypothetical protein